MATGSSTDQPAVATTAPVSVPSKAERHETLPESLAGTAYVFVIGLFIMTFLFQNYAIPSGSMEKTLLIGDHVVANRTMFAPQKFPVGLVRYRPVRRGDIIVFVKPNPETPDLVLVKRAIGLPGDRIHLEHGVLYRNGQRIDEPQISLPHVDGSMNDGYDPARDDFPRKSTPSGSTELWAVDMPNHVKDGELIVPDDSVFAMGDNRIGSADSRFWGFVPANNIVGTPLFVYWSFVTPAEEGDKTGAGNSIAWFGHVLTRFFSDTRWARTGHVIR